MSRRHSKTKRNSKTKRSSKKGYWVHTVTSDALDIPEGLFTESPEQIAIGLKDAAMESNRTRGTKFQSAMSMLNFYINRAGKNLSLHDRKRLEKAKVELRKIFDEQSGGSDSNSETESDSRSGSEMSN